jgi:TRAP-type C4-dicarboxylate transport system permease small subunit
VHTPVTETDQAEQGAQPRGPLGRLAFGLGAFGLLAALGADFAGVVGRHLGHAIPGAIELIQFAMVLAASAALVSATLAGAHASVHLVTERLGPRARGALERVTNLLGAALFAALCAGGAWVLADTIGGREASDLLHLPIAPLRLVWAAATAATSLVFLARAFRGGAGAP